MTSRLIPPSIALASAIVLANGLVGCDYIHRTFGGGDTSSGSSGNVSSSAGTSQSSPMYPNGYQSRNTSSAASTTPGTGATTPSTSSTMSSNAPSTSAGTGGMTTPSSSTPSMSSASTSGMTGAATTPDQIRQAQQALADQGLYKGKIDGVVGRQTRRAVRQFQKTHHLSQTARLDADTMQALGGQVTSSGGSK